MTRDSFNRAQQLERAINTLNHIIQCDDSSTLLESLDLAMLLTGLCSAPLRKDFLEFARNKKEEYEKEFESL